MEPGVKVKLSKVTCSLCKRTFNNYFYWHDHMRQEHESVFRQLSDGRTSSSFRQYYTLADEEQNFVEPSSNLQVENAQSPAVTQNGSDVSTSPQNGSNREVDKEESLPVTQNGTNVSTSPQNGSDLQQVDKEESFPAMENGTNVSTSPQNEALGAEATSQDLNAMEQTSFDQTSGTSSDSNLSSCEGIVTHNPDVHAEANSDPKDEPSTSYQQAEDKPEPGLFSLNKESLSPEVETSVPNRESSGKKPSLREYHESGDSEFPEKDGGRCTVEPPPNPIDPIRNIEVLSAIKNSRVPEKPCAKELFGVCMLPVFDPLTGTAVLRPHTVEVQSSTPYKDQESWSQEPCESPLDIADRILERLRLLNSKESESESSADEEDTDDDFYGII